MLISWGEVLIASDERLQSVPNMPMHRRNNNIARCINDSPIPILALVAFTYSSQHYLLGILHYHGLVPEKELFLIHLTDYFPTLMDKLRVKEPTLS